ncbi:DEAD/DEAH box helicase family protein [Neptuniibacter sp.]|uniref:DEAD/DEAH box helicase family protein n=1 Tax=Neptuniibacter sp. TaxID=1962643 RepID=UPI0026070302|nr:DEAD/DEAH box helicase family protein [Neptuniibacter sp.]MCP4596858.1 DEAD/DEAH box helicase family protein [Neptuniibacter sp.]
MSQNLQNTLTINTCSAAAGMGKTTAAINHVLGQIEKGQRFIIAAPSIALCDQIYKDCVKAKYGLTDEDLKRRQTAPSNDIVVIHSNNSTNVAMTLSMALQRQTSIIIITHSNLLSFNNPKAFTGYSCIIDELPKLYIAGSVKVIAANHGSISQWLIPGSKAPWYKLDISQKAQVEAIVATGATNLYSQSAIDLLQAALNSSEVHMKQVGNDYYYSFLDLMDFNKQMGSFNQIHILGANFKGTLPYELLEHYYGATFCTSVIAPHRSSYNNPRRVTIYPLLLNVDVSRSLLDTSYIGSQNRSNTWTINDELMEISAQIYRDKSQQYACYTQNKGRNQSFGHKLNGLGIPNEFIQYEPHGLNKYMTETYFAALFSFNPQPYDRWLLNELENDLGLQKDHLVKAHTTSYYCEAVFQFVTRSNIRDHNSSKDVHIVVPDMRACNYMANGWLQGCNVDTSYALPMPAPNKGGRPAGFPKTYNLTGAARKAFYTVFLPDFRNKFGRGPDINNKHDVKAYKTWVRSLNAPQAGSLTNGSQLSSPSKASSQGTP